jgi:hypothetical protein
MMQNRRGEKVGWTGGWIGSFIWVSVLALLWLYNGKVINGILGIGILIIGISLIIYLAPWRHPETEYWKLMLPLFIILIVAVALFVELEGGMKATGLSWWSILWLSPLLIPFANIGKRRWKDGNA